MIDRLDESAIVLPPGSVSQIRELLALYERRGELEQLKLVLGSRSYRVGLPLRVARNRWIRVRGTFLHNWNKYRASRNVR